uniref:Uncharacterized protein n=1 Tax=Ditylenchus dipsaci TaxID=166011 RepID=A0A915EF04_9BILA
MCPAKIENFGLRIGQSFWMLPATVKKRKRKSYVNFFLHPDTNKTSESGQSSATTENISSKIRNSLTSLSISKASDPSIPNLAKRLSIDHRIIITSNKCGCAECATTPNSSNSQQQQPSSSSSAVLLCLDNNQSQACWCRCTDCCCIENCAQQQDQEEGDTFTTTCQTPIQVDMLNGSSAASSSANSYCGASGQQQSNSQQTIEEQIKHVDRIIKDCDVSRKNMELINRRLDDLNDEVRRYREFLGHEKSRRDPALYKTSNVEQPSMYNEGICGIIATLTSQLTLEWNEKLRGIQNQTLAPERMTKIREYF